MADLNRRTFLKSAGASAALFSAFGSVNSRTSAVAAAPPADSLPMQLYKSMSDEQRQKVCLPVNHPSRYYVSNWWYVHRDHRIPGTFNREQQDVIQQIFDSLHHPDHQDAINDQVEFDQYGQIRNAPAVGFFGTPEDEGFEFVYTGHHVTRRCTAHSDTGQGFGGAPIFYGHFREAFHEAPDHPGNPYWYQGKLFNQFVSALNGRQQQQGLVPQHPRSEKPNVVIQKRNSDWPGLRAGDLSPDQQELLLQTMAGMLAMFRQDDVNATLKEIRTRNLTDQLHVSWYGGQYDVGGDQVWDTWQIESPELVWYFRGQPHIHSYFHLKNAPA